MYINGHFHFSCRLESTLKFMFDKFPGFLSNLAVYRAADPPKCIAEPWGLVKLHLHIQVQIYTQDDWFKLKLLILFLIDLSG